MTFSVTNTFVAATDAIASQVNTNFTDLTTALNNLDGGTANWANVKVSATTANPVDISSSASGTTELSINNSATDGDPEISFKLSGTAKAVIGIDDSSSDAFKIAHASALGTTATDDFILNTSTGAVTLRGTATTDSAAAGFVGEYIESIVANVNSPGSGTYFDATSISLTAGDWDVTLNATFFNNGGTWSAATFGISVTSGNFSTGLVVGSNSGTISFASSSTTPLEICGTIASYRVSISTTTIHYAKVRLSHAAGTPQVEGLRLSARRVR